MSSIIGRIEEAVEEETIGIRTDMGFDIKASNARKSRYLYELTRAMKGVGEISFLAEHRDGLKRLRETLARNEEAIRRTSMRQRSRDADAERHPPRGSRRHLLRS